MDPRDDNDRSLLARIIREGWAGVDCRYHFNGRELPMVITNAYRATEPRRSRIAPGHYGPQAI